MAPTVLHLRSETKHLERRSALTPTTARELINAGYIVNAEQSPGRIFDDEEFEAVGAILVKEGSWVDAPRDHIIIGLKELAEADCLIMGSPNLVPLHHAHVQFGHCYKQQDNWERYLSRFSRGNGTLYDIEFLTDPSGRRVAAFGYYAGYAGTAIALLAWANQLRNPGSPLHSLSSYASEAKLVEDLQSSLSDALPQNANRWPRVLIIGALGRCGTGAVNACRAAGIPESNIVKWDMAETVKGGPFPEIAAADIFVNCIYLTQKIAPFVTLESLAKPGRNLRVVCDVSCDPNNPNNPVPIYTQCSTFIHPTLPVLVAGDGPPLTHVSIDHMPSLLPREASEMFSGNVLASLLALDRRHEEGVWTRAEKLYREKVAELPIESSTMVSSRAPAFVSLV